MTVRRPGLVVMDPRRMPTVLGPAVLADLEQDLTWVAPPTSAAGLADVDRLAEVEVLVTGWGGPRLGRELLGAMPALRLVTVASGSIRHVATEESWERGVVVTSSAAANAVPVVQYTVAQIVLALKQTHRVSRDLRAGLTADREGIHGTAGEGVGLLSLGLIGRGVLEELRRYPLDRLVYDPFVGPVDGATSTSLEEVFSRSRVVSVHTPLLPETVGLVGADLVRSLPFGATLINTSRGAVLDEPAVLDVLVERPDLTAVLDVTSPEPPAPDSPLRTLPNVVLTGHVAGSLGRECEALGALAAQEVRRYVTGAPLQHAIDRRTASIRA